MTTKENKRLKLRIAERGLTYRRIAERTGIPLGSLCAKLNGYAQFNGREATLLCKALEIPAGDLFLFF